MAAGVDMREVAQVAAELLAPHAAAPSRTTTGSCVMLFLARFLDDGSRAGSGRVCLSITTLRPPATC